MASMTPCEENGAGRSCTKSAQWITPEIAGIQHFSPKHKDQVKVSDPKYKIRT